MLEKIFQLDVHLKRARFLNQFLQSCIDFGNRPFLIRKIVLHIELRRRSVPGFDEVALNEVAIGLLHRLYLFERFDTFRDDVRA